MHEQGVDNYIEEQLTPQGIDDSATDRILEQFSLLTMSAAEIAKIYGDALLQRRVKEIMGNQGMLIAPQSAIEGFLRLFGVGGGTNGGGNSALQTNPLAVIVQVIQATVQRQMYSERQLFEMMVDFWSNHFNIYILKNECRFLKTVDDRQVIRKNALGKFRDLLFASAHSPTMLVFLDNVTNVKGVLNENYARELMELHTLSVNGGYTQIVSTKLVRRFVSDDSPESLVASAADTFLKSDRDIGAVMSTILHSNELRQSFGQKAKRPLEYIASAVRDLGASETTGVI